MKSLQIGIVALTGVVMAAPAASLQSSFGVYTQTVTIVFGSAAAAQRAAISVAPLWRGARWACSSRWDDDMPGPNLAMAKLQAARGFRSTFFLNKIKPDVSRDKQLIALGHSIGGHGSEHAHLGWLSRNAMFEEVLRVRAEREAFGDAPVNAYAFAYHNQTGAFDEPGAGDDIAHLLARAGYRAVADQRFETLHPGSMPTATLVGGDPGTADGIAKMEEKLGSTLANAQVQRDNPCVSLSTHAWWIKPAALTGTFAQALDRLNGNPAWWYCTHNDYGAYRCQRRYSTLTRAARGNVVQLRLVRPCVDDLNNTTPLTLVLGDVAAADVKACRLQTTALVVYTNPAGVLVDVPHAVEQRVPTRLGWIANDTNRKELRAEDIDKDMPAVQALAWRAGDELCWTLRNNATTALGNVRVCYRVPLAWAQPARALVVADIPAGGTGGARQPLQRARKEYDYAAGRAFFDVELSFDYDATPCRLHLTVRDAEVAPRDASYPDRGFAVIGPVAEKAAQPAALVALASGAAHALTLPDGQMKPFVTNACDGTLDAELIRTAGMTGYDFSKQAATRHGVYVLRSIVRAPAAQAVDILTTRRDELIKAIFMNGAPVPPPKRGKTSAALRHGDNLLLLVVTTTMNPNFLPENLGIPLRLVKPGTRARVAAINYTPAVQAKPGASVRR
jgi:hypothetical protein